jgi:pyruvate formate-lyase/glycerol dehydratase family glycyl radical enzyme
VLRRARALERVLAGMEICIDEDQLIAGSFAGKPRGCQVFPEYDMQFVVDELDTFAGRTADRFVLTEQCKCELREIHRAWRGNSLADAALTLFPPDAAESAKDLVFLLTAIRSGVGHVIVDYGRAIDEGLLATMGRAEALRDALDVNDPGFADKRAYYEAVLVVGRAVIGFAGRFADLAESLAATADPGRGAGLREMAAVCRKVPARSAGNFREAIQSFWFIHLVLHLEASGHSMSPGRFDQYMYPLFRKDAESGALDTQAAEELLHCLWLKFFEINKVRDKISSVAFGGYPMFQNLILGGQNKDGSSAVTELSHLCLEATARLGLPQPSLSIRWYFGSDEEFMRHAMEVVSYGAGFPAMFNDEVLVPNMMQAGYSLEESRDYAIVGCTETTVPGISEPWLTGGFLNLVKLLELTIFDGHDPVAEKQYALSTGNVESFESFDQFMAAYDRQIAHYLEQLIACDNVLDTLHGRLCPTPFESIYIDGCLQSGRTSLEGGARYNFTTLEAVGIANVADSLAAIRRLVYDEASLTWDDLKSALLSDFADHEELRMRLARLPKYGNDDDFVDGMGARVLDTLKKEVDRYRNPRGGGYNVALYSVSTHVLFASRTGATPDGRRRGAVLADGGVSCSHGSDLAGLTALLKSVVKLDPYKAVGSTLLNVKLDPSLLEGESFQKIIDIVKTYFLMKGQHVQFNVIDTQTLRDAQEHPEKYPALTVRVAGFSVLFTTVDPVLQEDIIRRTEHRSHG